MRANPAAEALVCLCALLWGCDGAIEPDPPGPEPLVWAPCGLDDALPTECTFVRVPLDYDAPDGAKIALRVRRTLSDEPRAQLWFLQGGPGLSSVDALAFFAGRVQLQPGWNVYAVDHRGVGGSERLGCPTQEASGSNLGSTVSDAEWPACVAELVESRGQSLAFFTTTNAARDVANVMDRVWEPEVERFLWGASYGTYLANRYLQLFPEQISGVILEGIAPPGEPFSGYDRGIDDVGRELLDTCARVEGCRSRLGPDPQLFAAQVLDDLDEGHCQELGSNADYWRSTLGSMLFYPGPRDLVPAALYRLRRCQPADVTALVALYQAVWGQPTNTADPAPFSQILFHHVGLSELWSRRDEDALVEEWSGYLMSTGLEIGLSRRAAGWPTYARDGYAGRFADYDGPMLMLQGGLDPATPSARAEVMSSRYRGSNQTYALFAEGAHTLVGATPTPQGGDCAQTLVQTFLQDPETPADVDCVAEVLPLTFDGVPAINRYYLGTADAWGD